MTEESIAKKEYQLSILIPSLTERIDVVSKLIKHIQTQIDDCKANEKVQIIVSMDNRSVPLKDKRNKAQKRARGKYLCHIDDDDWVSDNFIKVLLEHIPKANDADVICYNQLAKLDKGKQIIVKPSLNAPLDLQPRGNHVNADGTVNDQIPEYIRVPWQWSCWRTELVRDVCRSDSNSGIKCEDINWLQRVFLENPSSQYIIDETLHIFNGDREDCESACGW